MQITPANNVINTPAQSDKKCDNDDENATSPLPLSHTHSEVFHLCKARIIKTVWSLDVSCIILDID